MTYEEAIERLKYFFWYAKRPNRVIPLDSEIVYAVLYKGPTVEVKNDPTD